MTSLLMFGSGKFEILPILFLVCVCVESVFRGRNVVAQVITGATFQKQNKNLYAVFMVPLSLVSLGASLLVCTESATKISAG